MSESEISTEWITVETADGPMRVFVARPSRDTGRAVVVLQEAFGVNEHIQDVSRRVADRGYLAAAPELFHRTGTEVVSYEDHAEAMSLIGALGHEEITTDVDAVLRHIDGEEGIGRGQVAIIGFCFGGRAAFTAATAMPGLGAVVAFYGPGVAAGPHASLDRAASITAPMLMHVGGDDPTIPEEHIASISAAMTESHAPFKLHTYPGAGHAFACDARPHMYREQASLEAWDRTYEFIDTHLPSSS